MRVMPRRRLHGLVVLSLVCLCGCDLSGLTGLADLFGGHLTGIGISGDTLVAVGDTVRLSAAGSLDGLYGLLSYDPVHDARWSSSDRKVAVVEPAPPSPNDSLYSMIIVRGVRPGPVIIRATARGQTGMHVMFVHRPVPPASIALSDDRSHGPIRPVHEQYSNR